MRRAVFFSAIALAALLFAISLGCQPSEAPAGDGGADLARPPDRDLAMAPPPDLAPAQRTNFLFILTDDQRQETAACMGKLQARLAARALEFKNSYAATPLCCPSRSSILTGEFAHNHGVQTNGDNEDSGGMGHGTPGAIDFVNHGNEEKVFAKWLHQAGYRTALFGKYLNGYNALIDAKGGATPYVPPYWDEWHAFLQPDYYAFRLIEQPLGAAAATDTCYVPTPATGVNGIDGCKAKAQAVVDDGQENFSTDVLTEEVAAFLKKAAVDQAPFFVYFAPKNPHAPYESARRYQPNPQQVAFTDQAVGRLQTCPLWDWATKSPSYLQADVSQQPEWVQSQFGTLDPKTLDDTRRLQLVSLLTVDDAIDELMTTLEDTGLIDSTVVVYSGDNGYTWGDHWWDRKNATFENPDRVPMLVYDPRSGQGAQTDWAVQNIDLAPTFAELAGVAIPPGNLVNGSSFAPLLAAGAPPARDQTLAECWSEGNGPDIHAAVRSGGWKYVEHYLDFPMTMLKTRRDGNPEIDLYDLSQDPDEVTNLSHLDADALGKLGYDPTQIAGRIASMQAALHDQQKL